MAISQGCKDDPECRRNTDCNVAAGEICQKGKCKLNSMVVPDSGSDTGSATVADTTSASMSDMDIDSQLATDSDTAIQDSSSAAITCVSNSDCNSSNPCVSAFCNTALAPARCDYTPKTDGAKCGEEGDPCMPNATCLAGECVGAMPCASSTPPGSCITYEGVCTGDTAANCSFTEVPLPDNTVCFMDSPCQQGVCAGGECVDMGNPCYQTAAINACTSASCQSTGNDIGEYTCQLTAASDGQVCQLDAALSPCYKISGYETGVPGYCMENGEASECIAHTVRACFDPDNASICAAQMCMLEDGSCVDIPQSDVSRAVQCGETVTLSASEFSTREYYWYGGNCQPMDVRGKELALTVAITEATNITFTVVDDGGQLIKLLHLNDMCDPNSCQSNASTTLSVEGMLPTDAIIIEPGIGNPPESIQISITCN